jgi:hypothetical protein
MIIVVALFKKFFGKLKERGTEFEVGKEKTEASAKKQKESGEPAKAEDIDAKFLLRFIKKLKFVQLRYGN